MATIVTFPFQEKEGKYFAPISSSEPNYIVVSGSLTQTDNKIVSGIKGAFASIKLTLPIANASTKKELFKNILQNFQETDFAVTDLSHSRAIIQIEGQEVKEILKKGCPFNFNILEKNNSINSIYNGIAFTVDMLNDNPDKVRLFTLRSFGESLYHSITDASLEFGYLGT